MALLAGRRYIPTSQVGSAGAGKWLDGLAPSGMAFRTCAARYFVSGSHERTKERTKRETLTKDANESLLTYPARAFRADPQGVACGTSIRPYNAIWGRGGRLDGLLTSRARPFESYKVRRSVTYACERTARHSQNNEQFINLAANLSSVFCPALRNVARGTSLRPYIAFHVRRGKVRDAWGCAARALTIHSYITRTWSVKGTSRRIEQDTHKTSKSPSANLCLRQSSLHPQRCSQISMRPYFEIWVRGVNGTA